MRAHDPSLVWDRVVGQQGPVHAAAADRSGDLFAKFPDWLLPLLPASGRLLDVGCGYGRLAIPIADACPGLRVTGIDGSAAMLQSFDELVAARDLGERVERIHATVPPLPLTDEQFDVALSCAVLLHNPRRIVRAIVAEMVRTLKPGGLLILVDSFPALENPEGLANRVLNGLGERARAFGPVRPWSRGEVAALAAGLDAVRITPTGCTLLPRALGPVQLPFGSAIRGINARAGRSAWLRAALPAHYQLVARRPAH